MRRIKNVVAENYEKLRYEIYNNYQNFDKIINHNQSPECIRIWDFNDIETNLTELEKLKSYLKSKYVISKLQIVIYAPFTGTGFHSDGDGTNRYIYPLISDDGALNLEIDINHSTKEYVDYYNTNLYGNKEISRTTLNKEEYLSDLNEWFLSKSTNNKLYNVKENECWEIGKNIHAHLNISFYHRIIVVFDTKDPIVDTLD